MIHIKEGFSLTTRGHHQTASPNLPRTSHRLIKPQPMLRLARRFAICFSARLPLQFWMIYHNLPCWFAAITHRWVYCPSWTGSRCNLRPPPPSSPPPPMVNRRRHARTDWRWTIPSRTAGDSDSNKTNNSGVSIRPQAAANILRRECACVFALY